MNKIIIILIFICVMPSTGIGGEKEELIKIQKDAEKNLKFYKSLASPNSEEILSKVPERNDIIGTAWLLTKLTLSPLKNDSKEIAEGYAACRGVYQAWANYLQKTNFRFIALRDLLVKNLKKTATNTAIMLLTIDNTNNKKKIPTSELYAHSDLISHETYLETKFLLNKNDNNFLMRADVTLTQCNQLDMRSQLVMRALFLKEEGEWKWKGE